MLERRGGGLQAAVQSGMPYFFARKCCRALGSGAVSSSKVSNCSRRRRTQLLTARMTEYQLSMRVRPSGIAKKAERAAASQAIGTEPESWRREGDSTPRYRFRYSGFQVPQWVLKRLQNFLLYSSFQRVTSRSI